MGCRQSSAPTGAPVPCPPGEGHQGVVVSSPCPSIDTATTSATASPAVELQGGSADWHPIINTGPAFAQSVGLVKAGGLRELCAPWPRRQEVPNEYLLLPKPNDLVVAVSHGWPYQAHPDPFGRKREHVLALIDEAVRVHNPPGSTAAFFDFCSVTQRPFKEGQEDRTDDEVKAFGEALRMMPKIYLFADAVLHVDDDCDAANLSVSGEGEAVLVDAKDLVGSEVMQLGEKIQVLRAKGPSVRQFDFVEELDGRKVQGGITLQALKDSLEEADAGAKKHSVLLRRSPMGLKNPTRCGDRGWVYLERFVSMVKGAMVDEKHFDQTCFSTSPAVVEEIRKGSRRLRAAAKAGADKLEETLEEFFQELDRKKFSAASTDKATNTGGCGGEDKKGKQDAPKPQKGGCGNSAALAAATTSSVAVKRDDRYVVATIMKEMVECLPAHWAAESQRQRERQLLLAVLRGQADEVRSMLSAKANPNFRSEGGRTCLHAAAQFRHLDVALALVESGGDLSIQDVQGSVPAHSLVLYATPETIDLFRVLAPSEQILGAANASGVRVARRFATWAATADSMSPYAPAQAHATYLKDTFPNLFLDADESRGGIFADFTCARRSSSCVSLGAKAGSSVVRTWESVKWGQPTHQEDIHIVMISGKAMPWALAEDASDYVAKELCTMFRAKVFVIHYLPEAVTSNTTLIQYQEAMLEAIGALPLNEKFVLVENAHGITAALLWSLRPRLHCSAMINFGFWFSDEFLESDAFKRMATTCEMMAKMCESKEAAKVCKGSVANMVHSGVGPDALAVVATKLEEELKNSPEAFWSYSAALRRWFTQNAATLKGRGKLDTPLLLLLSDSAPAASVQESARHAREVFFSCSRVSYIQSSNQWWEAESVSQHASVAAALVSFIGEHLPSVAQRQVERASV